MTTASWWTNTNLQWRKSSFSADNGECVEVAWRKSGFSAENGQCVEVAGTLGAVRDSKNPAGPVLHANLTALVTTVKSATLAR
jgi:hypothetical protein